MAVLEDLALAVEGLLGGRAVRWPDPPDLVAELDVWRDSVPEEVRDRAECAIHVLAVNAETLTELVDGLDVVAIRFGQDGQPLIAEALLSASDILRAWRDRG